MSAPKERSGPPRERTATSTASDGRSNSIEGSATQARYVDPTTLKVHPAAEWFDDIPEDQFAKFKEDIKEHGQRDSVVVKDNFILDGKNRARACKELGRGVLCVEYDGEGGTELAFVISRNLHRRHLTVGQRAEIAEKLAKAGRGGDRKTDQKLEISFDQPTIEQAAKTLHVSPASVKQVRKVRREAPEKMKAIKTGKLSPSKAVKDIDQQKRQFKGKGKGKSKKHVVQQTFEDEVWKRWKPWLQHWPQTRHKEVFKHVRKFMENPRTANE